MPFDTKQTDLDRFEYADSLSTTHLLVFLGLCSYCVSNLWTGREKEKHVALASPEDNKYNLNPKTAIDRTFNGRVHLTTCFRHYNSVMSHTVG